MRVAIPGTVSLAAAACIEWIFYCHGVLDARSAIPPLPEAGFDAVAGDPTDVATHDVVDDVVYSISGAADDIFVVAD
jgi:hypothetical protein